ncbi:hypothetical protein AB1Y20_005979 [Prymnesium parvum]|uniref:Aminotransferase class I/classII large domain-containing protein n=1 Tax=Prymnesium parvum TaxID=97485 RepID=A0AB34J3D7_PRYPA
MWQRRASQLAHAVQRAASVTEGRLGIFPGDWTGPRGNAVPSRASDPYLNFPKCEETLFTSPPGLINLDTGAPCAELLSQGARAMYVGMQHWQQQPRAFTSMQYGPTHGTAAFRRAVADFLNQRYNGAPVSPTALVQTCGATHGLSLTLNTFFGRHATKMAFVEDPCYFLAPSMLHEQGFHVVPVPHHPCQPGRATGLDVEALEAAVLAAKARGQLHQSSNAEEFAAVVYVVPSHHNPTGAVMPEESRRKLVRIARELNLLVLSDDLYELLYFPSERSSSRSDQPSPPARLVSLDFEEGGSGNVVSNNSFSKILGPGVRCGWIEARSELVDRISGSATLASSGGSAQLTGALIASAIEVGAADETLDLMTTTLASRMAAIHTAFNAYAPPGCTLSQPSGGMCAWLQMPQHVDSHEVLLEARQLGVSFKPGDLFSSAKAVGRHAQTNSARLRSCCRLVSAHYDAQTLQQGIQLLCNAIAKVSCRKKGGLGLSS